MHATDTDTSAIRVPTPWEGLGGRITATDSMLVEAGLDWQVERAPLMMPDSPDFIPGHWAMRRATDRHVLGIVGSRFRPVQNSEILSFFRSYVETGGATMETAGSLRGGRQVWALARLGVGFTLPGGDEVLGYLLMIGSHEPGRATIIRTTTLRIACGNSLHLVMRDRAQAEVRWAHSRDFDPDQARERLGIARETIGEFERNAELLQRLQITREQAIRILAPIYQPQARPDDLVSERVAMSPSLRSVLAQSERAPGAVPGTGWGLLNGATYHADHIAGRSGRDQALATAWYGNEAARKERVLAALLELTN